MDNVKIGVLNYEIVQGTALSNTKEEWQLGEISYGESRIYLDDNLSPQVRKQTLMHEIVHGMLNEIGHEAEREDEGLVNGLANQILMLLQSNPELWNFFTEKDRSENLITVEQQEPLDWLYRSGYFD